MFLVGAVCTDSVQGMRDVSASKRTKYNLDKV